MKYCTKCVMPDTKPGVRLDEEGVCQACRHAEKAKETDWGARFKELEKLCDKYRRDDGYYDCIIAVSGGKDSHFQIYVMKELMHMNPLLVCVNSLFSMTEAGRHNFRNMSEAFGCDTISLDLNRKATRKMVRIALEEWGSPTWVMDQAIYVFPIRMAIDLKIPLVIYGENVSYLYGGVTEEETYSAKDQIKNTVARQVSLEFWLKRGISKKDLNQYIYPPEEEIEKSKLDPIYLSYFIPWDGYHNYQIAKRYGFQNITHEWKREGFIEDYDQIDTLGYLVHAWLKYPKYGFARATDVACYWVWSGRITREEAIKLVKEHDHKLDQKALQDFLDFTGYTHKEFWDIVEKWYNREIFEKVDGTWKLKHPIWEQE